MNAIPHNHAAIIGTGFGGIARPRFDYGVSPRGAWGRRHHASSARAGVSAQKNASHTGIPKALAAASPIAAPAHGRSQKYRYGTALVANQPGRPAPSFLMRHGTLASWVLRVQYEVIRLLGRPARRPAPGGERRG
jgi:hypothetical protein